jgi:hypothetical protein
LSDHGNSDGPYSPLDVLGKAIKAVPAVRFALGVVGVSAAAALVVAFLGQTRASIIMVALVFVGMVILFAFSGLVSPPSRRGQVVGSSADPKANLRVAATVLLWAVVGFFTLFLVMTVTAVAFGVPCNWADFLGVTSYCAAQQPPPIDTSSFASSSPPPPSSSPPSLQHVSEIVPAVDVAVPQGYALEKVFGDTVTVISGGGANPGCQQREATSCALPRHGGKLVGGSGYAADVTIAGGQPDLAGTRVATDTPMAICITFQPRLLACEDRVQMSGRAAATELYKLSN